MEQFYCGTHPTDIATLRVISIKGLVRLGCEKCCLSLSLFTYERFDDIFISEINNPETHYYNTESDCKLRELKKDGEKLFQIRNDTLISLKNKFDPFLYKLLEKDYKDFEDLYQ